MVDCGSVLRYRVRIALLTDEGRMRRLVFWISPVRNISAALVAWHIRIAHGLRVPKRTCPMVGAVVLVIGIGAARVVAAYEVTGLVTNNAGSSTSLTYRLFGVAGLPTVGTSTSGNFQVISTLPFATSEPVDIFSDGFEG